MKKEKKKEKKKSSSNGTRMKKKQTRIDKELTCIQQAEQQSPPTKQE